MKLGSLTKILLISGTYISFDGNPTISGRNRKKNLRVLLSLSNLDFAGKTLLFFFHLNLSLFAEILPIKRRNKETSLLDCLFPAFVVSISVVAEING